ncbi:MAG: MmcQ/YjbR family DNA-binding protein [Ahrensia sp.]|nr:MmcQ/YjbR family DNA-binding protein [Ahrensia sp.]
MTRDEFNAYCASLPATNHVVQWGNADVWKVGPKVFAIGGWQDAGDVDPYVTFKVSDMAYDILKHQEGLRPAPYLASRGMKWIQRYRQDSAMSDADLRTYLNQSHKLIAQKLTKKLRAELGLRLGLRFSVN